MQSKIKKISASVLVAFFMFSFAANIVVGMEFCSTSTNQYYSNPNTWTPLVQCGNARNSDGSIQHCCDFNEAMIFVNRILKWFLSLAGTIAAITFSIAGGKMLLNPSDPAKKTEAKEMFEKTLWGLLIVVGAWLVTKTVITAFVNTDVDALRFLK